MTNYYDVLQVSPSAEPEVIEAAYRRLARKYHPDVYDGADAEQRMRQLNEAFEVLGDPVRRREYDRGRRVGTAGSTQGTRPPPPPRQPPPPPVERSPERNARRLWLVGGAGALLAVVTIVGVLLGEDASDDGTAVVVGSPTAAAAAVVAQGSPAAVAGERSWTSNAVWASADVGRFNQECGQGAVAFAPADEQDAACVEGIMMEDGASDEAVDFFRTTELFLTDFRELGEVDYAVGSAPWVNMWRANPLLLNGEPDIIALADLLGSGTLYRAVGDDIVWPEYSTLSSNEETPEGTQKLTFDVRLAPCRACEATGTLAVLVEVIGGVVIRVTQLQ